MPIPLYRYKYKWFCLIGFYGISTIVGYLMLNPLYEYMLSKYDFVSFVLWHINHCRLFQARFYLSIYIKCIWIGFVLFYGISTLKGYLISNPLYSHISNIYDLLSFSLWYINHCRLFNAKSSLCIYWICMIWFGWVYDIPTTVGYLMPNSLYTYILNIYNLVWLGFMAYQPL